MNKEVEKVINIIKDVRDNPTILDDECGMTDNWSVMNAKECKTLLDYINQLEKEVERLKEREKLVTEHYNVMVRHAGNLEGIIIQLEINRDEAIELLSKGITFCKNDSQGAYDVCNIAINREKKAIEILERGKE